MRWLKTKQNKTKKTRLDWKKVSIKCIKGKNDTDDVKTTLEPENRSNNVKASEWRTDFRISHSSKHVIKYKIIKTVENNGNPSLR